MFDFTEKFKSYSTVDLLKIVNRSNEYQPEAVKAASDILNERQVSNDEIEFVNNHFNEIEKAKKQKQEKIDDLKNRARDFFEPVINPSDTVKPNKWLNVLLLVIGLQYAWRLFEIVKQLFIFFQCDNCEFDISIFFSILTIFYVPLIFFLLLKRKRWGWILLFADTLFSLILRISQSYIFFKYQDIHQGDTTLFLFPIIIKAAFIYFLWKDSISSFFDIDKNVKIKTATITTVVTIFFIFIMYLIFR